MVKRLIKREWFFTLLSFLFPLIFYGNVFWGKSFGYDCSSGILGAFSPNTLNEILPYCRSILDSAAYVRQHPPHWIESARQYLSFRFPIWSQNIGAGQPLAANFISSAFFIPLIPFAIFFKISNANFFFLDLFFVFRYMIMSLGMYLFLRSFKLERLVCFIGSLAFFSSGYFIYFPNIIHHNVDMMLPLIGWSINNFYFKKETRWIGLSILFLGLSMLGGMPESSIFVLFFAAIYVLFLSLAYIKKGRLKYLSLGASIIIGGLLVSAVLYIPGLELYLNGVSSHHKMRPKSIDWQNIITYILPQFFGGAHQFFWKDFQDKLGFAFRTANYVGSVMFFLFLSSLAFLPKILKWLKRNRLAKIFLFYFLLTIVLLLQLFGIARFFFFEQFPVFKQTTFFKYSSALISFSLITSTMIFLHLKLSRRLKKAILPYFLSVAILILLNSHYKDLISNSPHIHTIYGFSENAWCSLFYISIIAFFLFFFKNRKIVLSVILLTLLFETWIYFPKEGDQKRRQSLKPFSSIEFVKSKNYQDFRIFALNNIMRPNTAVVFDLNDMRILDALWINRYFLYIKNFFNEPDNLRITNITESSGGKTADIVNNNFFDMLSVKYIFSYTKLEEGIESDNITQKILEQNEPKKTLRKAIFIINRNPKEVLYQTGPRDIKAKLSKPKDVSYLYVYPALAERSFGINEGDGVKFVAKIYQDGKLIDEKEQIINPSNNKEDERWFEMKLGPFGNPDQSYDFTLQLITDSRGNAAWDLSGWGGFVWDNDLDRFNQKYKLVYDGGVPIYENQEYLPRIRFVKKTLCLERKKRSDEQYDEVIKLMKDNEADIRNLAIVESNSCDEREYSPEKARIIENYFNDQKVSFVYSSPEEQYGFLSDVFYPGWKIYINGQRGEINPANLAFRGFKLPEGENVKVEIKYQSWTFTIGLWSTILTMLFSLYLTIRNRRLKD